MSRSRSVPSSLSPFRGKDFRRIWTASLFSNLAQQVQAVSAAWLMLQLTQDANMVSLVQTATMLPIMLLALPGGAAADMYDRRKVALGALTWVMAGAALLAFLAVTGAITPGVLLAACFFVGSGIAIFFPSWQASISELVDRDDLPSAISLYAISSNAARSVGPAIGGFLVAGFGASAALLGNAILYIPMITTLYLWRRKQTPSRLPPEAMHRAIASGMNYVRFSSPIRSALFRALVTATGTSAIYGLLPVVASDVLGGDARVYGLLLAAFGIGAIGAGFLITPLRHRFSGQAITALASAVQGTGILLLGCSPFLVLSVISAGLCGAAWMVLITLYNVAIQMSVPRWVMGRALATFQATVAAGLAMGAALWGAIGSQAGVGASLIIAGVAMIAWSMLGRLVPIPEPGDSSQESVPPKGTPDVALEISGNSGPVIVEMQYRISADRARQFYYLASEVQRMRGRNGAYGASLARDVGDPEIWIERAHFPTWNDYLRSRERPTQAERDLVDALTAMHCGKAPLVLRRMLERPAGSVRWKADVVDIGEAEYDIKRGEPF